MVDVSWLKKETENRQILEIATRLAGKCSVVEDTQIPL